MDNDILFSDTPPYESMFIRAVAAGVFFVMSPIFILLFFIASELALWALVLWIGVPVIVIVIPYLLIIPAHITITRETLHVRHGLWSIRIPLKQIALSEVVEYPPWWANFQYFFPNAQWIRLEKSSGRLGWWYLPTSSAAECVLAIHGRQHD
jgi:hypothetical protein